MSRFSPTILALILAFCVLSPAQSVGQGKGSADDSARLQQLYEVVSARYGPQVECRIGTLKGGRHFAQVTITDSAAFHSPPETQRERQRQSQSMSRISSRTIPPSRLFGSAGSTRQPADSVLPSRMTL